MLVNNGQLAVINEQLLGVRHYALPMRTPTRRPTHMLMLTPNEVAKRTGKSRRTIMRAIEAGEIEARRDNRNQWQISEDALAHWARSEQPTPSAHPAPTTLDALHERILGLQLLLDEVRASNAALQASNDDLRADRDAWRSMAQRPSWWRRLAG